MVIDIYGSDQKPWRLTRPIYRSNVNTACDLCAKFVEQERLRWLITSMIGCIIDHVADLVLHEANDRVRSFLGGSHRGIRKNLSAIGVDSKPDTLANSWSITSMEI